MSTQEPATRIDLDLYTRAADTRPTAAAREPATQLRSLAPPDARRPTVAVATVARLCSQLRRWPRAPRLLAILTASGVAASWLSAQHGLLTSGSIGESELRGEPQAAREEATLIEDATHSISLAAAYGDADASVTADDDVTGIGELERDALTALRDNNFAQARVLYEELVRRSRRPNTYRVIVRALERREQSEPKPCRGAGPCRASNQR